MITKLPSFVFENGYQTFYWFVAQQTILYFQENFGEEQIQYNMEKIGYRVGFSLVEKATKEEARFKENVEIVKYICKVRKTLLINGVHFNW